MKKYLILITQSGKISLGRVTDGSVEYHKGARREKNAGRLGTALFVVPGGFLLSPN